MGLCCDPVAAGGERLVDKYRVGSARMGFSIVFYRFLDSCKTMPILRNVLKSDTNKEDIMGYNEQWSFSMEFNSKNSKLP